MTRGRSGSELTLSERREEASSLYTKGFTVTDVARKLHVARETAKAYKEWHEHRLSEAAASNPGLLSDVLRNTMEMLAELDQVRSAAWRQYHSSDSGQIKLQALNTIRSAQSDKAKLFGLFGIKQDVLVLVTNVKVVQDRLLSFMRDNLCEDDRAKLEHFLMSPDLARYMQMGALPVLDIPDEDVEEIPA